MAKNSNKEWRLPSNIKEFIIILIKLVMWITAGSYILTAMMMSFSRAGNFVLLPVIFAIVAIVVGNFLVQLIDRYL